MGVRDMCVCVLRETGQWFGHQRAHITATVKWKRHKNKRQYLRKTTIQEVYMMIGTRPMGAHGKPYGHPWVAMNAHGRCRELPQTPWEPIAAEYVWMIIHG